MSVANFGLAVCLDWSFAACCYWVSETRSQINVTRTLQPEPIFSCIQFQVLPLFIWSGFVNVATVCFGLLQNHMQNIIPVAALGSAVLHHVLIMLIPRCAEVTESQQLQSIVQDLAVVGCRGPEPGVLIHCRGQVQEDVSKTVAEAQLIAGCTISLANPASLVKTDSTARYIHFDLS